MPSPLCPQTKATATAPPSAASAQSCRGKSGRGWRRSRRRPTSSGGPIRSGKVMRKEAGLQSGAKIEKEPSKTAKKVVFTLFPQLFFALKHCAERNCCSVCEGAVYNRTPFLKKKEQWKISFLFLSVKTLQNMFFFVEESNCLQFCFKVTVISSCVDIDRNRAIPLVFREKTNCPARLQTGGAAPLDPRRKKFIWRIVTHVLHGMNVHLCFLEKIC